MALSGNICCSYIKYLIREKQLTCISAISNIDLQRSPEATKLIGQQKIRISVSWRDYQYITRVKPVSPGPGVWFCLVPDSRDSLYSRGWSSRPCSAKHPTDSKQLMSLRTGFFPVSAITASTVFWPLADVPLRTDCGGNCVLSACWFKLFTTILLFSQLFLCLMGL